MKLWFDHQIFVVQRYGGISRYFVELKRALKNIHDVDVDILAPGYINSYLRPSDMNNPFSFPLRKSFRGLRFRPMVVAPIFKFAAHIKKPDLIHETHYALDDVHLPKHLPLVSTCHDMIFEKSPNTQELASCVALKRKSFDRAAAIICISENTRTDLLDRYPALESKVTVIPHGVDHTLAPETLPVELPEPYLLFVGTRSGYKNFANLVRAMGASPQLREAFHLVCFGGGVFNAEELALCEVAGYPIKRLHHVSGNDKLLAYAYKRAVAFVFPSRYEGFGMPLTEAMVQGCPIACSDASCFPEICGDAAIYFDADDVESIRNCLERLLCDETRIRLAALGRVRAHQFSWSRCAELTATVYRKAID